MAIFRNLACAGAMLAAGILPAETWYEIPLTDLTIAESEAELSEVLNFPRSTSAPPRVVFDQPDVEGWVWFTNSLAPGTPEETRPPANTLTIRAESAPPLTGVMWLPVNTAEDAALYRFEITAVPDDPQAARKSTLQAKREHYTWLANRRPVTGAAWFRHQVREAEEALGIDPLSAPRTELSAVINNRARRNRNELADTYDMFSGGRAVAETLQLDNNLLVSGDDEATVPIEDVQGVATAEYDWAAEIEGLSPKLDPLAEYIPANCLAVFFPSFDSLADVVDAGLDQNRFVYELFASDPTDAETMSRIEARLGLQLGGFARAAGPQLIDSVAFVASDPYLPTGTDMAVLFETDRIEALETALKMTPMLGRSNSSAIHTRLSDTVLCVSTAPPQDWLRPEKEASGPMTNAPEYTFFRDRYERGGFEDALFVMTDAAIRKWVSPQWRIANSRRLRAAAVLAELQAAHLDDLKAGVAEPRGLEGPLADQLGDVTLTASGVISEQYGSLGFLTPVRRIDVANVTEEERDAYNRFRANYENRWTAAFDPIAISLVEFPGRLSADATVRPLIAGTDYEQYSDLTGEVRFDAADTARGGLHFTMAVDRDSEPIRGLTGMMSGMTGNQLGGSPLNWFGKWLQVYTVPDAFWRDIADAATAEDPERAFEDFMSDNWTQLPVVLRVDVASGLRLTGFLATLRGFVESSAPGMLIWETAEHSGTSYVRITPTQQARGMMDDAEVALTYAALPDVLILTLREDLLKQALEDRAENQEAETQPAETQPADTEDGGVSLALAAKPDMVHQLRPVAKVMMAEQLRRASFANIPILNEWHDRFAAVDPVAFHRQWWAERPVCPGGGEYVWNEDDRTFESTVFGSPYAPKPLGGWEYKPLAEIGSGSFDLTFEQDGIRARGELRRGAVRPRMQLGNNTTGGFTYDPSNGTVSESIVMPVRD